jgi:hypothetical protein
MVEAALNHDVFFIDSLRETQRSACFGLRRRCSRGLPEGRRIGRVGYSGLWDFRSIWTMPTVLRREQRV